MAQVKIPVELFTSPRPKYIERPQFPQDEMLQRREGWVELSLMVDPSGKPFEVTVVRSTGNKTFEKLAKNAVERSTFEPGLLNGKPIESGFEMKFKFEIDNFTGTPGAQLSFVRAYKSLTSAVQFGDRTAADMAMTDLKVTNLYEDAYLGLAMYAYASKWGNESQQLEGLRRAIAEEDHAHYLPPDSFRSALLTSFRLEVNMRYYAEAMMTWKRLQNSKIDPDTAQKLKAIVTRLQAVRTDGSAYGVPGVVTTDGSWFLHLFKQHFQVRVTGGLITGVTLRCDKHHFSFAFDPALQYQVNGNAGDCSIELEGKPGTRLELIQL